jgi:hypothetical protein
MSERLDLVIPVSEQDDSGEESLRNAFAPDEVEWIETASPGNGVDAPRESADLSAEINELATELADLGDGDIPDEDSLTESELERFRELRERYMFLQKQQAATESVSAAVAPEVIDIGITLSENVSSGIVATYLYNRLSTHEIQKLQIGGETVQPITREKLKDRIEGIRNADAEA